MIFVDPKDARGSSFKMRIVLTGGAGYIASHIVADLKAEADHQILIIDDLSTGNPENVPENTQTCSFVRADASSDQGLEELERFQPEVVYHFAAFKAAGESMTEPEKYARNNISGTLRLIETLCKTGCRNFIFSSSAAVYGEPEYIPLDEKHRLAPVNYYGYTKKAIEENLYWFSKLRGIRFAALRYFNAVGYDLQGRVTGLEINPQNLLPIIMEVVTGKREKLTVFGNDYDTPDGTCIRDYVHVNDLSRAHILAMHYLESEKENLTVNLGSESGLSVLEVLEAAQKASGKEIPVQTGARRPGDPPALVASSSLAKERLNWQAEVSDASTIAESMWSVYKNT